MVYGLCCAIYKRDSWLSRRDATIALLYNNEKLNRAGDSMQLSVIIVNYNVKHFLAQCLLTVQKAIAGIEAEVIVVDNCSVDDSIGWLTPRFPAVCFVSNDHNIGFSKANNLALAQCKGAFVLFLNPDTLVPENVITESLSYFNCHPEAGALGVRMIDGNGHFLPESKRAFPSPGASFFKLVGLASLFPRSGYFNEYGLGNTDQHKSSEVPVLAGAGILVRKQVLDILGGFDEDYFMYGEDIDLSFRIRQLGFQNHYFAGATILHFKGKSSRKESFRYVKFFYGAMLVFVKKHYTKGAAKIFSFFIRPAIAFRATTAFISRAFKALFLPVPGEYKTNRTLIVATEAEYERILAILGKSLPAEKILGRVSINGLGVNAVCCLEELEGFKKKQQVQDIIFCDDELPLSSIFEQIQLLSGKNTRFFFSMKGSDSIIGSDSIFTNINANFAQTG